MVHGVSTKLFVVVVFCVLEFEFDNIYEDLSGSYVDDFDAWFLMWILFWLRIESLYSDYSDNWPFINCDIFNDLAN